MFGHPAYKLNIKDLSMFTKDFDDSWKLQLTEQEISNVTKRYISVKYIWVQGFIEQIAGRENEILIIRDDTGRAKVMYCNTVPGNSSWAAKGKYCSVVGTLARASALPEIAAIKVTDLSKNSILPLMWPGEVKDLKLLLTEQAMPRLA